MELNHINQKENQPNFKDTSEAPTNIILKNVFDEKQNMLVNESHLFLSHFNSIPNIIDRLVIDCKAANKWFAEFYKLEIKESYYSKNFNFGNTLAELDDVIYILTSDVIVIFDIVISRAKLLFKNYELKKVEEIIEGLKAFKIRKRRRTPRIHLLINTNAGIKTNYLKIVRPKLNIDYNYNNDFKDIHQTIYKRLSKKNDKGLVLLHGKPGTGKTSYIRYLICTLKKNVIFLPPNMARAITNPDLISVLVDNPNSILVIEDAENIIIDREQSGNSPVSTLLNISDGLLSDCLNIQIICSFNTDISKIDSALMRKGRLIAKYEFKELEVDKARQLSNLLGFNSTINSPMTLTSIYNQEEKDFTDAKRYNSIGFKTLN